MNAQPVKRKLTDYAGIAVLEYRVAELEELCKAADAVRAAPLRPTYVRRPATTRPDPVIVVDESDELAPRLDKPEPSPGPVSFDQIQQIVDNGETYEVTK